MEITGARYSGVLFHITSIYTDYGIGDMGRKSYEFVDRLKKTGATLWQILPLGPTGYGNSPYAARSTFAGNELLIDLLSQAEDYAWFYTPYLILGDKLTDAITRAASRGVDVRIIMPGIPDKKIIYRISRSFYPVLLKSGVKIYEYTPGFVHAKAALFDDEVCTIGTVNLDYRSLFLHFENNSIFYRSSVLEDLKKDYLDTQAKCTEVIAGSTYRLSFLRWITDGVLRIIAPLC